MKKLFLLFALFILFPLGCERFAKKEEVKDAAVTTDKTVIARVNGRPVYKEDLRNRPVETVIDYEILYEAGLKKGLDKKVANAVEEYEKRLIVSMLQRDIVSNLPKDDVVSEEEIMEYYNNNKFRYALLGIKEITVEDKDLAQEVHKKALSGEDLDKIAADYSKSGKNVKADTSRFNRKYNNRFTKLEVGSVSEIIEDGNTFKILKITEVKEIPFDKVKQAVKYTLSAEKKAQAMHEYVEKMKNENNIKVEIIEENK